MDWESSRAYGLGLNSIYLNKNGREIKGQVEGNQVSTLIDQLKMQLSSWRSPSGDKVVQNVWSNTEVFSGPMARYGPDLVLGYSPGFRASAQTGLGDWEPYPIEENKDHWGADHCIDPQSVPGVLFSSQDLKELPNPSYEDIPFLAIGGQIEGSNGKPPPRTSEEDDEIIEERLKSLGYL